MTEKNPVSQETMQEILRQKYATREESKFRREIKRIFTLLNDKCDEADAIFPGLSFDLMNQIFAPGGKRTDHFHRLAGLIAEHGNQQQVKIAAVGQPEK